MTASPQTWRLDNTTQTLVFSLSAESGVPDCIHWGEPLPGDEDLPALAAAKTRPRPKAMLDAPLSQPICPTEYQGWLGHPGLEVDTRVELALASIDETADRLTFRLICARTGLLVEQTIEIFPDSGAFEVTAKVTADTDGISLNWFSPCALPLPDASTRIIDFGGRWCGEFQLQDTPWPTGLHVRESREGRTSHGHFPAFLIAHRGTTNTQGEVYGLHLGWSGGHRGVAEALPDGRRQVQLGALIRPGEITLAGGESYEAPKLSGVFSEKGFNGAMASFHTHARHHVITFPDASRSRPVIYNCWEAVYFDHDLDVLMDIAERVADLGAERFVLDDGWFPDRRDDTAGLGNWEVDREKYPNGLTPLIERVRSLDMTFGLWVEPEMISERSTLHRHYPDWVLSGPVESQVSGRHQYVLDLTRAAVTDYLFEQLDSLLRDHNIDFLKWDHNRPLVGGTCAQTEAFYGLLDRLHAAHPTVEFESCSAGGGRIDFGVLSRAQRVWLSDSNDAMIRLRMQHQAVLFIPPEVTGSHVGPRRCHTSGRVLSMAIRAWTAAQRHMGYEMDPRELTESETDTLKQVTAWWKSNRDWMRAGQIHRLETSDPESLGEMTVSMERDRFVLFAGQLEPPKASASQTLRLTGLDPYIRYRVRLINAADFDSSLNADGLGDIANQGMVLSGRTLMTAGFFPPNAQPATVWVFEGQRVD